MFYETSYSPLTIGTAVLLEIIAAALALSFGGPRFILIYSLVPLFFLFNVFSVTVAIDDEAVRVRYGIGIFGSTIPFEVIQNLDVVRANLISWLYNPGQEDVLKIVLRYGGETLVPLGDPRRLIELISGGMRR